VTLAPFGTDAIVCYADEGHNKCTVLFTKLTPSSTKLASKSHDVTKLTPLPLIRATVVMGGSHTVGDVFGSSDAVPCAVSAVNDDTAVVCCNRAASWWRGGEVACTSLSRESKHGLDKGKWADWTSDAHATPAPLSMQQLPTGRAKVCYSWKKNEVLCRTIFRNRWLFWDYLDHKDEDILKIRGADLTRRGSFAQQVLGQTLLSCFRSTAGVGKCQVSTRW